MSGGSERLQQELRSGSQARFTTLMHKDAFTGVVTPLVVEEANAGQVTVDVTATYRRVLAANLAPQQSVFDLLAVPGGEITASQTYRYIDNQTETVPLGVFCVTAQSMGYRPDGVISLNCPDRYFRVKSAGFGLARSSVPTNPAWAEIQRLVEGAWPNAAFPFPGWAKLDKSATTRVGSLLWSDGDRDAAINQLLKLNSVQVYFDENGLAVLERIPQLTSSSSSVYTVMTGPVGTLKDATRGRDTSVVHNVIVLATSAADVILDPVVVANTRDPALDPLSSLGPIVNTLQVTDNFQSTPQMQAAGRTILNQELTVQQTLDVTSTPNPCLAGYDVIDTILATGDTGTRPTDRNIIEAVTHPLSSDGEQGITVRAARATVDDTVPL